MTSYYYVILAAQGLCLLHMIKNRADQRWFFLVVFVPGIGALIYVVSEVLPRLRGSGFALQIPMLEQLNLKALEKQFRFSDTVDNRVLLAEAYLAKGRNREALELYRPVLQGPFKKNPYLLYGYAKACFCNGEHAEALSTLDFGEQLGNPERQRQRRLLKAMVLEALGDARAGEAYQAAVAGFHGEEARCRYGLFLAKRGDAAAAKHQFDQTIEYAGFSDRDYRRRERVWIRLAKTQAKEIARARSAPREADAA
jgi:hypothetical protein